MHLAFQKILRACKNGEKIPFSIESDDKRVQLEGMLSHDKKHADLLKLSGVLKGSITLICDLSGEEYDRALHESLGFYLSDGIVNLDSEHFEDIFECKDGNINLSEILDSELEMIRCDYHTKND